MAKKTSITDVLDSLSTRWSAYSASTIDTFVSPIDDMLDVMAPEPKRMKHYMSIGQTAVEIISEAMVLGRRTGFDRILDLPCGGGRVTRHLKVFFPDALIVVSELDKAKQSFVTSHFGVPALDVPADFSGEPKQQFDLIFVGSLLTHLNQVMFRRALDFLMNSLSPNGILVVTVHGRAIVNRILSQNLENLPTFRRTLLEVQLTAIEWLALRGFNFHGPKDYGTSISLPSWVAGVVQARSDTSLLGYRERAWGGLQDVLILQKIHITGLRRSGSPACGACLAAATKTGNTAAPLAALRRGCRSAIRRRRSPHRSRGQP